MDGPGPRKRASSVQESFVGFPEFPPDSCYRSHSIADGRSSFKKWAALFLPYTGTAAEQVPLLEDEVDVQRLPVETLGHSLARTSCYSRPPTSYRPSSQASVIPESSMISCILTLTKTILGSGMLGLPYLCHVNGIGLFTAMLFLFSALNAYTMYLLVWATDLANRSSPGPHADVNFGSLGEIAFGTPGLRLVQVIIGIDLWGTLVAYMVVIADIVQPAIARVVADSELPWLSWRLTVIGLTTLFVWPLCTGRSIGKLSSAAALGLLALSTFVAFLLFRCANTDFEDHLHHAAVMHVGFGAVQSLPMLAFVYNAHFNVFSIYNSLESRSTPRMGLVIVAACAIATLANVLVGISGDLLFQATVQDNVLQNMALDDLPAATVRSLFGVALVLTYPVVAFELRQMVEALISDRRAGSTMRVTIAAALVASSSFVAIAVPNITVAFGLVGGTTTTAMAFVLPPAFFLKLRRVVPDVGRCHQLGAVGAGVTLLLGIGAVPLFTYLTLQEALRSP
eukprot:EG_transcript_10153